MPFKSRVSSQRNVPRKNHFRAFFANFFVKMNEVKFVDEYAFYFLKILSFLLNFRKNLAFYRFPYCFAKFSHYFFSRNFGIIFLRYFSRANEMRKKCKFLADDFPFSEETLFTRHQSFFCERTGFLFNDHIVGKIIVGKMKLELNLNDHELINI